MKKNMPEINWISEDYKEPELKYTSKRKEEFFLSLSIPIN